MTANAVRPVPPDTDHPRRGLILAVMSACVVLAVALVAAINLAIPKLSASGLHPTSTQMLWIVDAYVIVFACLLIPAGALGDRYGRKGVLLTGLATFAAGCVACACAPSAPILIAGRALTGVGAALIMPASLSLSIQCYPPSRRAHTIATWTAATGAAGVLGNIGGGVVLEYLPWQGLFWLMVPIAVVLLALAARLAPRGARHPAELDLPGTTMLVAGFVSLIYGIIDGAQHGWTALPVLGAFGIALLIFAIFVGYALRAAHPVIDPRVFADPQLRAGTLGVTVTFFGLFALFYVNAQYLQYAKGYSPLLTGLAIGPLAVGMVIVSRRSVALTRRFGMRWTVAAGLLTLAAGLGLLSLIDARTPYLLYAAILIVMSVGMGLSMPTLSAAIIGALPHSRAGLGSGLNSATREVGSALGVAVLGTVLTARFTDRLPAVLHAHSAAEALGAAQRLGHAEHVRTVTAFTDAMSIGFRLVAVVVLIIGAVVVYWLNGRQR